MEWLNFHHLRYFWTVARKGGVRKAAEELRVSQPSISAQLKLLGGVARRKAFPARRAQSRAHRSRAARAQLRGRNFLRRPRAHERGEAAPGSRALRLNVGMTDALSKLIAFEILKPAFQFRASDHVICRQAEIGPLVNQLQAHRLDIVLADEPASSSLKAKIFNHRLGRSGVTFCAVPALATKLRRNFPRSLHGAPALLPSENMGMRIALETWFDEQGVRPRLVGEFEDATLMIVAASGALGFTTVPTVVEHAALKHYGLK